MYGHIKTPREPIDRHFEKLHTSEIGYVLIPTFALFLLQLAKSLVLYCSSLAVDVIVNLCYGRICGSHITWSGKAVGCGRSR